jgi:predicted TIM-barrel fold metal-dependent hydrolase
VPPSPAASATTVSPVSTREPPLRRAGAALRLLDVIGEDNVMLECDYPHSDSTWPDTIELANTWLGDLPEDAQHKITVGNASRVYDFTPADPATIAPAGVG